MAKEITCDLCGRSCTDNHIEVGSPTKDICMACARAVWAKNKKEKLDPCPECGEGAVAHPTETCELVLGRRGWRQLGVYDG